MNDTLYWSTLAKELWFYWTAPAYNYKFIERLLNTIITFMHCSSTLIIISFNRSSMNWLRIRIVPGYNHSLVELFQHIKITLLNCFRMRRSLSSSTDFVDGTRSSPLVYDPFRFRNPLFFENWKKFEVIKCIKTFSYYPPTVSGIWTGLTWLWWFGFRLEPISSNDRADLKNCGSC